MTENSEFNSTVEANDAWANMELSRKINLIFRASMMSQVDEV
jgi:hypothetical protein